MPDAKTEKSADPSTARIQGKAGKTMQHDVRQLLVERLSEEAEPALRQMEQIGSAIGPGETSKLRALLVATLRQDEITQAMQACGMIPQEPARVHRTWRGLQIGHDGFAQLRQEIVEWVRLPRVIQSVRILCEASSVETLRPESILGASQTEIWSRPGHRHGPGPTPMGRDYRSPGMNQALCDFSRENFRILENQEKPEEGGIWIPANHHRMILGMPQERLGLGLGLGPGPEPDPPWTLLQHNRIQTNSPEAKRLMNHGDFSFATTGFATDGQIDELARPAQALFLSLCKIFGTRGNRNSRKTEPETPWKHRKEDFKQSAMTTLAWLDSISEKTPVSEAILEESVPKQRTPRLIRDIRTLTRRWKGPPESQTVLKKGFEVTLTRILLADPKPGEARRKMEARKGVSSSRKLFQDDVGRQALALVREAQIHREFTPQEETSGERAEEPSGGIADTPELASALSCAAFLRDPPGSRRRLMEPCDLDAALESFRKGRRAWIRRDMEAEAAVQMLHRANPKELIGATRMGEQRHHGYAGWAAFASFIIVRAPSAEEAPPLDPRAIPGPDPQTRNFACALATANSIAACESAWEILSASDDRGHGLMPGRPGKPRAYGRADLHQAAALIGAQSILEDSEDQDRIAPETPIEPLCGTQGENTLRTPRTLPKDEQKALKEQRLFWLSLADPQGPKDHPCPRIQDIKQRVWWTTQRPTRESMDRLREASGGMAIHPPWAKDAVACQRFLHPDPSHRTDYPGLVQDQARFYCAFRLGDQAHGSRKDGKGTMKDGETPDGSTLVVAFRPQPGGWIVHFAAAEDNLNPRRQAALRKLNEARLSVKEIEASSGRAGESPPASRRASSKMYRRTLENMTSNLSFLGRNRHRASLARHGERAQAIGE